MLESVGGWAGVRAGGGLSGAPGFGMLESVGGWACVRVEGSGAPGFWMLESVGGWACRRAGVDPGSWILETGLSEGRGVCGPRGFCILYSVFCRRRLRDPKVVRAFCLTSATETLKLTPPPKTLK